MKSVVIVQARMGSKRFPSKSMADLFGKPVLQHVLERAKKIGPEVVLAVPDKSESRPMVALASRMGVCFYLGSEDDVLGRYACAARAANADVIMRITGDCPFIEPSLCKKVLDHYGEIDAQKPAGSAGYHYITHNIMPRTYPRGTDCEAFGASLLQAADAAAESSYDREHVTPWMYKHAEGYGQWNGALDESNVNWCIDYPDDLKRLELRLVNVDFVPDAPDLLYQLLEERDETINISHKAMPTWKEHLRFVKSNPYRVWYLIDFRGEYVGSTYLTDRDEIGIFILKKYQGAGLGERAVKLLMETWGERRYLANVNPRNERAMKFFQSFGFRYIQNTMALEC